MRLRFGARYARSLAVSLILAVAALAWLRFGPLPAGLLDPDPRPSLTIVDRNGEVLFEARSSSGTRGETIDAAHLPPAIVAATLAAEDERFRSHVGVDPIALGRAFVHDVRAMRIVEGGSTITQQVAKLLLARQKGATTRGWRAKIQESVIALRLEHRLTKDQILALYLNLAPFGNQIVGVERASRAYFGRAAGTLTPAEAAFLAALPQRPGRYNPWTEPAKAKPRQQRILAIMHARGWLNGDDYSAARKETMALHREPASSLAPHFIDRLLADQSLTGARRLESTLDAPLQRTIAGILAAHRALLDAHHAESVAVAVLDNRTGEWLAWEGSGNYLAKTNGSTIDGVTTPRQPGSALKPFTYAAAFERGSSPGRVLADVPSQFPTAEAGVLYSPRNYDGRFRGPLLARAALAGSENVPAVALASDIGVPAIARLLRQSGLTTLNKNAEYYGLGLTLGNAEVRLDELVGAYAMLARGGERVSARAIRAIDNRAIAAPDAQRVLSARTAFWITDILSDADARAYIFGRGGSLEFPFAVAAKTGTSQAYHDNWALGYTRDVTVGVWVGNFDRSPLRDSSGVTGAGPIFHDVMVAAVERVRGSDALHDRTPIAAPTADVHRVELCAKSGMLANEFCPTRVSEWAPLERDLDRCTWHHDSDGETITIWPEEYRQWARTETGTAGTRVRGYAGTTGTTGTTGTSGTTGTTGTAGTALTIVAPLAGATYLFDPTLRAEFQQLALRAQGGSAGAREWAVDGVSVGRATPEETLRWSLERGTHVISVRDSAGAETKTQITVR